MKLKTAPIKITLLILFFLNIVKVNAQDKLGVLVSKAYPRTTTATADNATSNNNIDNNTNSFQTQGVAGVPTGNSEEVGTTDGSLSVSLSGAANYAIPIKTPPGINGVEPQINIEYNSQRGNGIAGFGWSIKGVSVISRIPSTKLSDNGVIDPVDLDNYDRFAIDGERLVT